MQRLHVVHKAILPQEVLLGRLLLAQGGRPSVAGREVEVLVLASMSAASSERRVRRNDPCPCGSGLPYKQCCIQRQVGNTAVQTSSECPECDTPLVVDLAENPLFQIPDDTAPLRLFARENGVHLFESFIRVGQIQQLTQRLRDGSLKRDDLMETFSENATVSLMTRYLEMAVEELPAFQRRSELIVDIIDAHFTGKYSLSVAAGFALLEGVLRDTGGLTLKEDLAITIPLDRWEHRLAPEIRKKAESFRSFLTDLFKGGQEVGSFNRNPVLHGADTEYGREDWSLMLLMSLFEVRLFEFLRAMPEVIK